MKRYGVATAVFVVIAALIVAGLAIGSRAIERDVTIGAPVAPSEAAPSEGAAPGEEDTVDPEVTTPPDPALAEFYSQQLSWGACEGQYECATLTVPLNYAEPAGETIDLAVLRFAATGTAEQRIGSMVVNPGGPGAPGTDYAVAAPRVFRNAILESFDVVGFDPRGTGDSAPVDCLTDQQMDDYLSTDPDPDTQAEERAFMAWSARMGQGCVDRSGDLANHISTIEAARDMDVLRAALGEPKLMYFGASYGTKLGATYADLFPERVGRLVLDGAVDVGMSSRQLSLGQAQGFQRALEAYVTDCVDGGGCFLGDDVDAGLATIADLLVTVDREPLPTGGDRQLTEGLALLGIITPLYGRENWFLLDDALQGALDGDGAALLQLADIYASRDGDGTYADNSTEAIFAINCLDDPWAIGANQVPKQVPRFERASPTLGRIFAWMLTGCSGVQAKTTEEPREITAAGADPILVVGTTRDPATPYEWAVALADDLESGVLLSRDGDGHTAYNSGNECIDVAIETYLVDGTPPADGTEC